ncbi:uncharacterized protein LOC108216594 [Daucus carota subsp. sativus]|uniref:uncharacterized protein LOC108216594 n=1 Tax=Daucus carota subsp. sativus TaxID=79200 RepID=UPI0007EF7F5C|nr:PREDICTED: uncharacterized protein LOC108216594 [Daucus carota subsp. sativus]XP_017244887.1 PREDICTED: uncharacterized protein LOC108216594 [Daucus carota subsp. sativus]XP_017244888.1 PREDICTED: uncharacterized protein LOC108216594 [Daucus carota subsp. sativus]XP_017244889.1 PREDICTED: uncharacterized protein LOC108216594 [Daucus carota subsp. sativus]
MEMKGNHGSGNSTTCNVDIQETLGDKIMMFSSDQVMVLEQFFAVNQVPSHVMRLAMIHENSVLSNLDSQQIEAWFENRRTLENSKMIAMRQLLMLEKSFLNDTVEQLSRQRLYLFRMLRFASTETYPAPGAPRSVSENLMVEARRELLLLENELLHGEVQQLNRGNGYIQSLLENVDIILKSEVPVNSDPYLFAKFIKGLLWFSDTMTEFPPRTSIACDWVQIPRMKFLEGTSEIFVKTSLDWTYFPVNGIIVDASVMLSFVKAAMIPDGTLNPFLRQHQEFVVFCSVKDIKLDQIFFKDGEKSSTAIVPALLPLEIKLKQTSLKEEDMLTAAASSFLPQDIKLEKIAFKDREESLTAVSSAFLPQRFGVAMGRYCVLGTWRYVPNGPAASGEVKFMLRFKFIN